MNYCHWLNFINYSKLASLFQQEPPFLFVDEGATGNDRFTGYIPDLLKKIKRKTNIDYELKLVSDGQYGSLKPNGRDWNGMVGEVLGNVSHSLKSIKSKIILV